MKAGYSPRTCDSNRYGLTSLEGICLLHSCEVHCFWKEALITMIMAWTQKVVNLLPWHGK